MPTHTFTDDNDSYTVMEEGDHTLLFLDGDDTLDVRGGTTITATLGEGDDRAYLRTSPSLVYGDAGDDRFDVYADADGSEVHGGSDDDQIVLRGADDVSAYGDHGHDRFTIMGGMNLMAHGGSGDDIFVGSDMAVSGSIYGDEGSDRFYDFSSSEGSVMLHGGAGNDVYEYFEGSAATFSEEADEGTDTVEVHSGTSYTLGDNIEKLTVVGGRTTDEEVELTGNEEENEIYGRDNDEMISGHDGNDVLYGGRGDDRIYGGRDNDRLDGGQGDDLLRGGAGDDRLNGRDGDDVLVGDEGNDRVFGEDGDDRFNMNIDTDGRDTVDLGEGDDNVVIYSDTTSQVRLTFTSSEVGNGNGNDSNTMANQNGGLAVRLQAEDGFGALSGGSSRFDDEGVTFYADDGITFDVRDLVSGTERGDEFTAVALGTDEADTHDYSGGSSATETWYINGGQGDDMITGGDNDDFLVGGAGRDMLSGGDGDDRFIGGGGDDTIEGGGGADMFIFTANPGEDTITDFESGEDHIDLRAFSGIDMDDITETTNGSDTTVWVDTDHDGTSDFSFTLMGSAAPADSDYMFA